MTNKMKKNEGLPILEEEVGEEEAAHIISKSENDPFNSLHGQQDIISGKVFNPEKEGQEKKSDYDEKE